MEKMLLRLARQLDGIDEASLMALWSKYATTVSRFEPTKAWEEAALVFSLIQAKHWKNQLFNISGPGRQKPRTRPRACPRRFSCWILPNHRLRPSNAIAVCWPSPNQQTRLQEPSRPRKKNLRQHPKVFDVLFETVYFT